jgi:hypothetical protein
MYCNLEITVEKQAMTCFKLLSYNFFQEKNIMM